MTKLSHIRNPEILSKNFTYWFKKCSDEYIFYNPGIHRIGNAPNLLCPRCKEHFSFKCNLISLLLLKWAQKKPFEDLDFPFKQ